MTEATQVLGHAAVPGEVLAPGSRVGAWRVLRVLGRGGMGEVYLAERGDASFDKQVALKLVHGVLTPAARQRFADERQALARLEHPHIARLIDAGESELGWPYLVMEYIDGKPLDEAAAGRPLDEILAIFLQVCDALAYAHRQLVLHRDIKPNNILVDRDAKAKLLDFGVAKLLQSAEVAEESRTVERAYTPDYASPEQVLGRPIGVASDVYSLGVVLYRLLTGQSPYRFDTSDTATLVHALADVQILPPSRAVLTDAGTQASDCRKRSRQLAGDLDTVLSKALQQSPDRRYTSVDAFADDLRRFLAHQPIHARPDTFRYRARMFLRRNTLAVIATTAVLLAVVGGLASSLWQAHLAYVQRALAERRFEDVRGLAHAMIFDLHDAIAKLPGSTKARALLVHQALTYLQHLGEERNAPLPLQRELAEAWLRVGDVQGAPGSPNLGDLRGALSSYAQADARVSSVLRAAPGDRPAQFLQAQILNHRAIALYESNALADADRAYRRDIELWTRLRGHGDADAGRGLAHAQSGLGSVLTWTNRIEDGLQLYAQAEQTMQAVDTGKKPAIQDELFLAGVESRRGESLDWQGRSVEAHDMLQRAMDRLTPLQRSAPDDPTVLQAIVMTSILLGDNASDFPDKRPMLAAYQQAHAAVARQVAADPADMLSKRMLALSDQKTGDALDLLKRPDEALVHYTAALQEQLEITAHDPHNQTASGDLGNTWFYIGNVQMERKQPEAALAAYRHALALRQALLAQEPKASQFRRDVAVTLGTMAAVVPEHAESCTDWIATDNDWLELTSTGAATPYDKPAVETAHKQAAACRNK